MDSEGRPRQGNEESVSDQRFEELREQTGPAEAGQMEMASLASRLGKKPRSFTTCRSLLTGEA